MRRHSRAPRIYSSRKYQNPFFHRRRTKIRRISLKIKLLVTVIIAVIVGLIWVLLFNTYFLIDNVVVNGTERIDEHKIYRIIDKQLQKSKFFFFNQQNIFIFSKRQSKKEILTNFNVSELKINKDLPRLLTISFVEKIPAAIWLENENYYYVDSELNILSQVDSLEIDVSDFIILQNEYTQPLIRQSGEVRKVSITKEYLLFSLEMSKLATGQGVNTNNIFEINEQERTICMQIIDGPKIYFNLENDVTKQFNKLKVLLTEKLNPKDLRNLDYIDLRFGDKIYYK